jgi:hypothetical protein
VTGVLAFIQPFSIGIIGLHALMGFVFIALIGLHVVNNSRPLASYLRSKALWAPSPSTAALTLLFWWQPAPVKTVLGWSGNLGPAMERFEMREDGMVFDYARRRITRCGSPSNPARLPHQPAAAGRDLAGKPGRLSHQDPARTCRRRKHPTGPSNTPAGRRPSARPKNCGGIDAVSSPTPNGSFDPADYILPPIPANTTPYSLLMLEINQPGDNQASLVYAVEIDNSLPRTFQLLELRGYPKREDDDADGKETWSLYYVDDSFTTALDLIDSALLTIEKPECPPPPSG